MKVIKVIGYINSIVLVLLLNFQFFEFHVVTKLFISWVVCSIVLNLDGLKENFIKYKKQIFLNTFWLIPLVLSLIYSSDFSYGLKRISSYLLIIVAPFIFIIASDKFKEKTFKWIKYIFPIGNIIFGAFIIFKLCFFFYEPYMVQYGKPKLLEYLVFVYEHRFGYLVNKDEIEVFTQDFHKAYYSIALLLSVIFVQSWSSKLYKVFTLVLIGLMLAIFKSIPHYIGLGLILATTFLWHKKSYLIRFYVFCISLIVILFCFSAFRSLIIDMFDNRIYVYQCSLSLISSSPFLGYGIGDVNNLLESCYSKLKCMDCYGLNSHNEFFNIWLIAGLFGIVPFFGFLYYGFKKALNNYSFFIFFIFFIVSFAFENIFARMWGGLMFSFFYGVFSTMQCKVKTAL